MGEEGAGHAMMSVIKIGWQSVWAEEQRRMGGEAGSEVGVMCLNWNEKWKSLNVHPVPVVVERVT